jgi:hypothetical protein
MDGGGHRTVARCSPSRHQKHPLADLNAVVGLCILAEIVASLGVGALLLWRYQVNPLHVIWSTPDLFGADASVSGFFSSKLAASVALCGWALLGFESAGSIAEEVRNPEWAVPRAIIWSLWSVGAIVSFAALSIILAIPNLEQVVAGAGGDPVAMTLTTHLGSVAFKLILVLFIRFRRVDDGMQASVSGHRACRDDGPDPRRNVCHRERAAGHAVRTSIVSAAFRAAQPDGCLCGAVGLPLRWSTSFTCLAGGGCAHLRGRWRNGSSPGVGHRLTIYLAYLGHLRTVACLAVSGRTGTRWIVPIMTVLAMSGILAAAGQP